MYNATQPPYWKSSHQCSATPQCYSCALSLQNLTHCHIALLLIDITVPPIYTTIKKKNKHHSTDKLCQEGCSLLKLLMFTVLAMQILALIVFPNHSMTKKHKLQKYNWWGVGRHETRPNKSYTRT